jgi:hypothetical protein
MREDEEEGVYSYWRILEIERGSTRWHAVENWLWRRLWTCRKTDCGMNE